MCGRGALVFLAVRSSDRVDDEWCCRRQAVMPVLERIVFLGDEIEGFRCRLQPAPLCHLSAVSTLTSTTSVVFASPDSSKLSITSKSHRNIKYNK